MTPHRTWLIIEPYFDGHHHTYLDHILRGALDAGIRAIVAVGTDDHGEKTREALARDFGGSVEVFAIRMPPTSRLPGPARLAQDEIRRREFMQLAHAEAQRIARIDHVFLPHLDWALYAIALAGSPFGRTPYSGITMRQRFHFPAVGIQGAADTLSPLKGRLFLRLLGSPTLRNVFAIDETLVEHVRARGHTGAEKVAYLPDPADPPPVMEREEARRRLGLPADACIVLAYGYFDRRKGVDRLLAWLGDDRVPAETILIAAGNQDPDVAASFEAARSSRLAREGRLRIDRRFVPADHAAMLFAACDLVWLGYDGFDMMSGVLVLAAQHQRAVVCADFGLIGRFAATYGVPYPDAACSGVTALLPPDLQVRSFAAAHGAPPLPDHSWANAHRILFR